MQIRSLKTKGLVVSSSLEESCAFNNRAIWWSFVKVSIKR